MHVTMFHVTISVLANRVQDFIGIATDATDGAAGELNVVNTWLSINT